MKDMLLQGVKRLIFMAALLLVSPLIMISWLEKRLLRSEWLFVTCAQTLAVVPGLPGAWLRGAFYFGTLDSCSWETHVGFGSVFTHRGGSLGWRASMGAYCVIGHGRIGDRAMLASRVSIPSGKRQHLDEAGRLADITTFEYVSIGERSWIGEGAIVMADVGPCSIVSAGAVVLKSMPGHTLIGGNPAKVLRDLEAAEQEPEQSQAG